MQSRPSEPRDDSRRDRDDPLRAVLERGIASRRAFLMLGAVLAAGCASQQRVSSVPDPEWPTAPPPRPYTPRTETRPATPAPKPSPPSTSMPGVLPRSGWAKGDPVVALMNPMLPITSITVHHDGMTPFLAVDQVSSCARIELIRSAHRNKRPDPWGDIGYHFVIDRAGRVWEGRPLSYQGAHVRNRNEGNIGVLCLGNFEAQSPSDAQLRALAVHVRTLRTTYRVSAVNVRTHREWPGASTLCPGRNLQVRVESMRSNRAFA